jgi:hypothetical protein
MKKGLGFEGLPAFGGAEGDQGSRVQGFLLSLSGFVEQAKSNNQK